MSTRTSTAGSDRQTQWLWLVIAILGVAVFGLGWAVLSLRKPAEPAVPTVSVTPSSPAPAASPQAAAPQIATTPAAQAVPAPKPTPVTPTRAPVATPAKTEPATAAPAPLAAPASPAAPKAVTPAPAKETCLNCATVVAVTPLERSAEPSGAGAVAGGVLGALVGQQFGGGSGKTAATIIGAVGGGMAGNEIEKKMKRETVYQVQVRMDDGSTRSFEQTQPASVGTRVRVEGNTLLPLTSN